MNRTHRTDPVEGTCSIAVSSIDDKSRNSGIDTYSDRNSSSGSELSELAIHALLLEARARDLDREVHQDLDSDRYLICDTGCVINTRMLKASARRLSSMKDWNRSKPIRQKSRRGSCFWKKKLSKRFT